MIISTLLLTSLLVAASPSELLKSAQTQLDQQLWQEAASTLDELVAMLDSPSAEINYDRGIAYYNLEQYGQAAAAFEKAMAMTDDPTLASFCAYNFGNAVYQSTMRELEGSINEDGQEEAIIALDVAKSQLEKTINSYRRAIAKNESDLDARANGELAWKMLQQLDAMQEEMEQQQQQDDQNNEQEQDEESAEEQADNQQNQEQGDSDQESQEENQEGEQSESQDQQSSEDQQQSDDAQPSDQQQEGEDPENQQSQDENQGEESDQKEKGQQPQQQSEENSNEPEGETDNEEIPIFEEGDLESPNEEGDKNPIESMDTKEEGERLSRSEASRLLQLIRDKEQQRRKILAARKAARRVPVNKDW